MNTASQHRHLNPLKEKRRRLNILTRVVPALLNRLLRPVLGWRRFPFILGMLMSAPAYGKRFSRPSDDVGMKEVKRTFLLVGVLYNRLRDRFGEDIAFQTTH